MFNLPGLPPNGDPRTPDIVITSNVGVIYTGHQKKVMSTEDSPVTTLT